MKNIIINVAGGLVGAGVLTLLHETVRRLDADAPRVDLVGEEALNNVLDAVGAKRLKGAASYATAITGDLLSNGLYYSTIGGAGEDDLLVRGATVGLTAGWGALALTKKMGLDDSTLTRSTKSKLLTVGYYLAGGIAAACTIKMLRKRFS